MTSLYDERYDFQKDFIKHLVRDNGYRERKNKDFDPSLAMDKDLLIEFLEKTQKDTLDELRRLYKDNLYSNIIKELNSQAISPGGSLIDLLKNGVKFSDKTIQLMYIKPETSFNKEVRAKYEANIFSVMEEVAPQKGERVDLVIFLNGLAIVSLELKSEFSGQTYEDAISQYRRDRDPDSRLFKWKAGCLVNFAMDTSQVHMATQLKGEKTFFMPFNMGRGEGVDTGAGNPIFEDKLSVSYMWEDILKKDSLLELIKKFVFIEEEEKIDRETGEIIESQALIFPRYHQRDMVTRVLEDVRENGTKNNYLIEHSAGSGKTYSIAWLAHRLVSLHNADNEVVFDSVIVVTDRLVVDRQLQKAVSALDHDPGLIKVMDEDCTSEDLRLALEGHTKIIVTTIQKFLFIVDEMRNMFVNNYGVIIDEAHSSTAGKNMQAIKMGLASSEEDFDDLNSMLKKHMEKMGKPTNVSFFAFTATPTPESLKMFGVDKGMGGEGPFHLYSMKQAIEEGYILDVLQKFTTYNTFYKLNMATEDDPELKTASAMRQIAMLVDLDDTNIQQRIEIIVEHFRSKVMAGLDGKAKAMVVTSSREAAVKYRLAMEDYLYKKKYIDVRPLVAFSGEVLLNDETYTEVGMNNGLREADLPRAFDTDMYNILIVANKYQTGFDQRKLSAMYVIKGLKDVNAVQTLSRLNRICPGYDKEVFVLDFVNNYDDIKDSFEPYYTTTILADSLDENKLKNMINTIMGTNYLYQDDIDRFNDLEFEKIKKTISPGGFMTMRTILQRTKDRIDSQMREKDREDFVSAMGSFKKAYEFLVQVTAYEDVEVHKVYVFVSYLLKLMEASKPGPGFDISDKVFASDFVQEEGETYEDDLVSEPDLALNLGQGGKAEGNKERLSKIIKKINAMMGIASGDEETLESILHVRDTIMESDSLKKAAINNDIENFSFAYDFDIKNAMAKDYNSNKKLYSYLLENEDARQEIFAMLIQETYDSLRGQI